MGKFDLDYDAILEMYDLYYFSDRTHEHKKDWDRWIQYTSQIVDEDLTGLIDQFNMFDDLIDHIYQTYYKIAKNKLNRQIDKYIDSWVNSKEIKNMKFPHGWEVLTIYDIYSQKFIERMFKAWIGDLFDNYFIWGEMKDILLTPDGQNCSIFDTTQMEMFYDTLPQIK